MASLNAIPRVPCRRILVAQSCYDSSLKITLVPRTGAVAWRGPGSETTMRTLIQGGWVVGYNNGGHELIPNGCVVFEDDRVVHVGRRFEGTVERRIEATGKLVSPGFVNCHLHAATNAGQAVFLDGLKADYFGSNFIGYLAPRRGAPAPRAGDRAEVAGAYGLWSALRRRHDDPRRRHDAWWPGGVHSCRR